MPVSAAKPTSWPQWLRTGPDGVGPGSAAGSISHSRSGSPMPAYQPYAGRADADREAGAAADLGRDHGERERMSGAPLERPVEPQAVDDDSS